MKVKTINKKAMKKLILILVLLLTAAMFTQTVAQKTPVDRLFEKYANKEGFTTVNISGKLLGLAGKMDSGDQAASEMISKLDGIKILTVENPAITGKLDFYAELEKDGFFKNNNYEVLMEVTDATEVVRFLAKDGEKGKLSELLLVVGGDNSTLISISGIIDPENIGKITSTLNINPGKATNNTK